MLHLWGAAWCSKSILAILVYPFSHAKYNDVHPLLLHTSISNSGFWTVRTSSISSTTSMWLKLHATCNGKLPSFKLLLMSAPFVKRILTILTCPFWQAIYKGDPPLSLHLFPSELTLSNSFTTMSKCPL
jgi:hypothetical protein